MAISNKNILDKLNSLEINISKLNDIIIYQTKIIQDLQGDNIKLNDKIIGLFNNIDNSNIIQSNKIDKIIGSNNKLNSSNINNSIVLTDNNIEIDSIDYSSKDKVIDLFKDLVDIDISDNNIVDIQKLNNKESSENKHTHYIIKLSDIKLKSKLLHNKKNLVNTNLYIQDSLSKYSNNLFYIARTYKKAGKIIATWIYKSQIYIETNNNNKILILNETQLNNFI